MQPAALELLGALAGVLDRWGRWYLFGAQAVVAYGAPRFSADVDVTVRLDPDDPARFVRDMEAAGFALRVDDHDAEAGLRWETARCTETGEAPSALEPRSALRQYRSSVRRTTTASRPQN